MAYVMSYPEHPDRSMNRTRNFNDKYWLSCCTVYVYGIHVLKHIFLLADDILCKLALLSIIRLKLFTYWRSSYQEDIN